LANNVHDGWLVASWQNDGERRARLRRLSVGGEGKMSLNAPGLSGTLEAPHAFGTAVAQTNLEAQLAAARAELAQVQAELDAVLSQRVLQEQQQRALAARIRYDLTARNREIRLLYMELSEIRTSFIWRITSPLRLTLIKFPSIACRLKQALRRPWRATRSIYYRSRRAMVRS